MLSLGLPVETDAPVELQHVCGEKTKAVLEGVVVTNESVPFMTSQKVLFLELHAIHPAYLPKQLMDNISNFLDRKYFTSCKVCLPGSTFQCATQPSAGRLVSLAYA